MQRQSVNSMQGFAKVIKISKPQDQPKDTISCIVNDPNPQSLGILTGSWDGYLRYYNIVPSTYTSDKIQIQSEKFLCEPIISCCFGIKQMFCAGLANGEIYGIDTITNQQYRIGFHNAPICKIFYYKEHDILMSLGFDCELKFWSLSKRGNEDSLIKSFEMPGKTVVADFDFPYLMIGTQKNQIYFINLQRLSDIRIPHLNQLIQFIDFGSKFTCVKVMAKIRKMAVGCIDGRYQFCSFEDMNQKGIKIISGEKIGIRSQKKENSKICGQVNSIQIGLYKDNIYLMIGGTQELIFFNIKSSQTIKKIHQKVTSCKLSIDGSYLFYSIGNDWCEGINDLKKSIKPTIKALKLSSSGLASLVTKTANTQYIR